MEKRAEKTGKKPMLYVGINMWSWNIIGSYWFMVLAVYYAIMAVMRFLSGWVCAILNGVARTVP